MPRAMLKGLWLVVCQTTATSCTLSRITMLISLLCKLLTLWGVTEWLGDLQGPVMGVVGLLGEMGLCHRVIEDTLLMMVIGAHLSGILWGRGVFSLVLVGGLVLLLRLLPEAAFLRYCYRRQ